MEILIEGETTMSARSILARQPNERLQALIQEAGVSNAGLARRVNLCGAEHGLDLRYDKTSVGRWVRGQQPRGRVPEIIAEALGRKLGRTLSVEEIGMAGGKNPASEVGLHFAPTVPAAVEQVCDLWRNDARGRNLVNGATRPVSALVEPSRDWLITEPDPAVARCGGVRVVAADVAAVRKATEYVVELDHRFGSGHVRPIVVHYLDSVVSVLLTGSYREEIGRQLMAAAARLTELAGYMSVDTGRPGLAQRYYIQALRLAQAAGYRGYGGYVLASGMSHLAGALGSPREVVQLARVAQEGARGHVTPTAEAMFYAAEARGYALLRDVRACRAAADKAMEALERGNPEDDPEWITHFDRAYLADELAHCHRDLEQPEPAARWAEEALARLPDTRVRRRVIDILLLAAAQLTAREVERACETATRAVDLLCGLRSTIGAAYLGDFRRRLDPYRHVPVAREFEEWLEGRELEGCLVGGSLAPCEEQGRVPSQRQGPWDVRQ
jgi:hypothetical protein